MADQPPLRYRVVLAEASENPDPWNRHRGGRRQSAECCVVRNDGAVGPRSLILSFHFADEDHATAEVDIVEVLADGRRVTFLKRRRVDRPTEENELARIAPNGQGISLQQRMHWPAVDCLLRPADIVVGATLPLFGYGNRLQILAPEDERTRNYLKRHKLPGSDVPVFSSRSASDETAVSADAAADAASDAASDAAASAAASAAAAPRVEPTLSFFLGGPRPNAAAPSRGALQPTLTADEDFVARMRHVKVAAWPPLREHAAVSGQRAPPLSSELMRTERARRYGETRVVFKARSDHYASGPRTFLLFYYVADDTLQVVELHRGNAGSQFGRRHAANALSSGEEEGAHCERTTLLRRCRAPSDLTRYLDGVSAGLSSGGNSMGAASTPHAGDGYVGLGDLRCGAELSVAGTRMRVTCCEPSSRALLIGKGLATELADALGLDLQLPGQRDESGGGDDHDDWPGRDLEPFSLLP